MSTQIWLEKNQELVRSYKRKWYENNKEKHIEGGKIRKKELKKWVNEYKVSKKCKSCSENHIAVLDFHHRNPKEKDIDICVAISNGWSKKRLMKEIEKCDVLCSNCHRKLHYVPIV